MWRLFRFFNNLFAAKPEENSDEGQSEWEKRNADSKRRENSAYVQSNPPQSNNQASKIQSQLPSGRVSIPVNTGDYSYVGIQKDLQVVQPEYLFQAIPLIRRLVKVNPDFSQALHNIVTLANTGHQVFFDQSVSQEEVAAMRDRLFNRPEGWSEGTAGIDSLVNKMFSQAMIGGAVSAEWIPNSGLNGVAKVALVAPEDIRWVYDKKTNRFTPYQYVKNPALLPLGAQMRLSESHLLPLNEETYKYFALNGDTESPYGFPPYLAAFDGVQRQRLMLDNITFIIKQIGIMGFLQVWQAKPDQADNESEGQYAARLNIFIEDVKRRVEAGFREGIVVGYKDDTEFKYHEVTKNATGVQVLFQENELQILSALKMDGALMGRDYGTSETQIGVVFTKLLSEIKNVQNLVQRSLEFGYNLDLKLAGFTKFKWLKVEFKSSTISDELKMQQAQEIKIRNLRTLYADGIIDQETYADKMGFERPSMDEPRFPTDLKRPTAGTPESEEERKDREEDKDTSDRKSRDRNQTRSD